MAAIPVKVDNIKRYGNFRMTRCTYLTIECDCPSPEWSLSFKDQNFPFYLFGLSGHILKPLKGELFDTPELISGCGKTQPDIKYQSALRLFKTSSTWPATLTLRQSLRTMPFSSMRRVERIMPFVFLPYIAFSP